MPASETAVRFESSGATPVELEGRLSAFDDEGVRAAAVLCHPGIEGQTGMEYPVIAASTIALQQAGLVTLRFNFRGVQSSAGRRSSGVHEVDDVLGAVRLLRECSAVDADRVCLVGDSFGAWMALEAARVDHRIAGWACVVLPLLLLPAVPDWLQHDSRPKLFIVAEHDQFCDLGAFKSLYQGWAEPKELLELAGTDHFLGIGSSLDRLDRSEQIAGAVAAWAKHVLAARHGQD